MWKIAKNVRNDLHRENWKFEGSLNNFKLPVILSTFLKWVIAGPRKDDNDDDDDEHRRQNIDTLTSTLTQLVSQSFK